MQGTRDDRDVTASPTAPDGPETPVTDLRGKHRPKSGSSPDHVDELHGYTMFPATVVGIGVAIFFGWIPVIGAVLAGLATGYLARSRLRGLYAAFIPGVITSGWYLLWTQAAWNPIPIINALGRVIATDAILLEGASSTLFALVAMSQFLVCVVTGWFAGWLHERRHGAAYLNRGAGA